MSKDQEDHIQCAGVRAAILDGEEGQAEVVGGQAWASGAQIRPAYKVDDVWGSSQGEGSIWCREGLEIILEEESDSR